MWKRDRNKKLFHYTERNKNLFHFRISEITHVSISQNSVNRRTFQQTIPKRLTISASVSSRFNAKKRKRESSEGWFRVHDAASHWKDKTVMCIKKAKTVRRFECFPLHLFLIFKSTLPQIWSSNLNHDWLLRPRNLLNSKIYQNTKN